MKLLNTTDLPAGFLVASLAEDLQLGCVIVRPTFRIEGETLVATPDEPWPIADGPVQTPWGELPTDTPFLNGGIDVLVMGDAMAPGGAAATELDVDVKVGPRFHRRVKVFGDRRWEARSWSGQTTWTPSAPRPFLSMPTGASRAFGGKVVVDEQELPWSTNPDGRGFCIALDEASGVSLANVEDPDHLVRHPLDQPPPLFLGPCKMEHGVRWRDAVVLSDDSTTLRGVTPHLFNQAHPDFVIPAMESPRPRDVVEITHMHPDGPIRFRLPSIVLQVVVQLEERQYVFPMHLDQIGVVTSERRVFLSYRSVFKYRLVPREIRTVTVRARGASGTVVVHSVR